jgi:hypothetical protein
LMHTCSVKFDLARIPLRTCVRIIVIFSLCWQNVVLVENEMSLLSKTRDCRAPGSRVYCRGRCAQHYMVAAEALAY